MGPEAVERKRTSPAPSEESADSVDSCPKTEMPFICLRLRTLFTLEGRRQRRRKGVLLPYKSKG